MKVKIGIPLTSADFMKVNIDSEQQLIYKDEYGFLKYWLIIKINMNSHQLIITVKRDHFNIS